MSENNNSGSSGDNAKPSENFISILNDVAPASAQGFFDYHSRLEEALKPIANPSGTIKAVVDSFATLTKDFYEINNIHHGDGHDELRKQAKRDQIFAKRDNLIKIAKKAGLGK